MLASHEPVSDVQFYLHVTAFSTKAYTQPLKFILSFYIFYIFISHLNMINLCKLFGWLPFPLPLFWSKDKLQSNQNKAPL